MREPLFLDLATHNFYLSPPSIHCNECFDQIASYSVQDRTVFMNNPQRVG